MGISFRAMTWRRTVVLALMLLVLMIGLLALERDSGSKVGQSDPSAQVLGDQLIKKDTPSSDLPPHCTDGHGKDDVHNKHCIPGQSS